MTYQTAYDITTTPFPEWPFLLLMAAVLLGATATLVYQRRRGKPIRFSAFVMVAASLAVGSVSYERYEFGRLQDTLAQGDVQVAEGLVLGHGTRSVEFIRGMGKEKRRRTDTYESFHVGAVPFAYYRKTARAGFRNGDEPIVQLADGMRVRIHYLADPRLPEGTENRILKFEIAGAAQANGWPAASTGATYRPSGSM